MLCGINQYSVCQWLHIWAVSNYCLKEKEIKNSKLNRFRVIRYKSSFVLKITDWHTEIWTLLCKRQKEASELIKMFVDLEHEPKSSNSWQKTAWKRRLGNQGHFLLLSEKMLLPMHCAFPRVIWRPGQIIHTVASLPHHFYKAELGLNLTTF